jgi:hypothetical protein
MMSTPLDDGPAPATRNARVGLTWPTWSPRRSARFGATASETHDIQIDGKAVTVHLCKLHLRSLLAAREPISLATTWAP